MNNGTVRIRSTRNPVAAETHIRHRRGRVVDGTWASDHFGLPADLAMPEP